MANQRTYKKQIEYRGEKMTCSEMAARYNLNVKAIYKHLSKYGNLDSFDERLKRGNVGGTITYKGRCMGAAAWAKELGLTKGQVSSRWRNHKSLDAPPPKEKVIEHKGERHTYAEWAKILGVTKYALKERMKKHGTLEIINNRKPMQVEYKGEMHTIAEWSKILNVSDKTLFSRYKSRGTIEKVERVRPPKPPKPPKEKKASKSKSTSETKAKRGHNAPVLKNGHTTTYWAFLAELEKIKKEEEEEDLKPLRYYV